MRPSKRTLFSLFLLLFYVVFTITAVFYHEPWRDELQAWLIARELSIPDLFHQMRYEGHFALWSLLLYPFAHYGAELYWMGLLSCAFMIGAAYLLLFRSPFRLWTKVCLLFSFPMLYYFPVVSRPYALIPILLFGLAILYRKIQSAQSVNTCHHYAYCILLGLLAHTHAYMEGMVGALFLFYLYDYVWPCRKEWRAYLPASLPPLFVLGAYAQVAPAFSLNLGATRNFFTLDRTIDELTQTLSPQEPIIPGIITGIVCFGLLVAFLIHYSKGFNPRVLLLLICGIGWQIYFSTTIYGIGLQRAYLGFFMLIFAFWILSRRNWLLDITLIVLSLLSLQRLPEIVKDFTGPYTPAKEIAEELTKRVAQDSLPIYTDNMTKVIAAYAPSLQLRSLREGTLQPLYTPHTLYRNEPFETRVDSTPHGAIYYVRTHIGIDRFLKKTESLKDQYQVTQLIPRKDAPPYIRELFYLYRICKVAQ